MAHREKAEKEAVVEKGLSSERVCTFS